MSNLHTHTDLLTYEYKVHIYVQQYIITEISSIKNVTFTIFFLKFGYLELFSFYIEIMFIVYI